MRNQSIVAFATLFSFLPFFASASWALPQHGGPEFDPTDDFNATSTVDTVDGRAQTLVSLDDLISPESRARIDASRQANQAALEHMVSRRSRGTGVDLRYRDTEVKKQFGGTCTAFGLMGTIENLLGGKVDLSERHFWSEYHQYSCSAALKAASSSWGVVGLDWWPDNQSKPFYGFMDQPWYKLTKYEALDGDITKAIASLDAGNPVYVGLSTQRI